MKHTARGTLARKAEPDLFKLLKLTVVYKGCKRRTRQITQEQTEKPRPEHSKEQLTYFL